MGAAAETDYPIRRLVDGRRISLGQVGAGDRRHAEHTWESISVLVRYADRPAVPKAEWTFRGRRQCPAIR